MEDIFKNEHRSAPPPAAPPHGKMSSIFDPGVLSAPRKLPSSPAPAKRSFMGRAIGLSSLILAAIAGTGIWLNTKPFYHQYALAEFGRRDAQYLLGAYYKSGQYATQDYTKAAKWFKYAADQGYSAAQYEFGFQSLYGLGVPENHAEARRYLRLAADQERPGAQFLLGGTLLNESTGAADLAEGEKWLWRAARNGFDWAEIYLANEYISGKRLTRNYLAAHVLFNELASRGSSDASKHLVQLELDLMTPDEVAKARELEAQAPASGDTSTPQKSTGRAADGKILGMWTTDGRGNTVWVPADKLPAGAIKP